MRLVVTLLNHKEENRDPKWSPDFLDYCVVLSTAVIPPSL